MLEEIRDFVMLGANVSIVGLHSFELLHAKELIGIAALISIAYSVVAFFEAIKLRKEIVRHHRGQQ